MNGLAWSRLSGFSISVLEAGLASPRNMSILGIGVVGAARWGSNVVRAFAATKGASLRGVCDLRPELLARVSAVHPGVRVTRSFDELLADPEVDAVALAVDAGNHHRLARRALEAGRHVLVEKPLALTVAHGEELCEVAERTRRILMVGHLLLYHPAVLLAKRAVGAGELGELRYIHAQRVNRGVVRANENVWWSLAPHDIAVAMYLFGGSPCRVSATGGSYLQTAAGIEDVAFATLTWADGRMAHVHVSWLDLEKRRTLTVVGSKNTLTIDGTLPVALADEPLRAECQHFVECVRTGQRPRSDGVQGVAVVRILDAGERSMRAGGASVSVGS
jgi:predicted dehydrogenase